jgi:hypothetical protein
MIRDIFLAIHRHRDSSVGRASDRRSEGPGFDPGSRQISGVREREREAEREKERERERVRDRERERERERDVCVCVFVCFSGAS